MGYHKMSNHRSVFKYFRTKLVYSICILMIFLCISSARTTDEDNNSRTGHKKGDHRHRHHYQHFRYHQNSYYPLYTTNNKTSIEKSLNSNPNLNSFNHHPEKQNSTLIDSNNSHRLKQRSSAISQTGNNFIEDNNNGKHDFIIDRPNSGNDWWKLKSLNTNKNNNFGYSTYNSVSNQDSNKNGLPEDVEIIRHRQGDNEKTEAPSILTDSSTTTAAPAILKGKNFHKMNDGRHICVQHKTVQIPVKTREIYSRPTWKHISEPCKDNQLCTRVQLVHEPVYRDIVRHKSTRQLSYECCPGWEPTTKNSNSCMKPVCKVKCKNGGTCIKPDVCSCPTGFTGKFCEEDINECKVEKPCDQLCFNTEGSYYCECREEFILMSDKQSCKKINVVNVDDAFEARDMENDVDNIDMLSNRLEKLEKMITMDKVATNELLRNYQSASHSIDSLKTRLSSLEKQQQDITSIQDKLLSNDAKTKTLEYLVNVLLKCQKYPHTCQQI